MKGVVLRTHPAAQLVDLCHAIRPGDIPGGAFVLEQSALFFPAGTVHVAVVDPGVGSPRSAIALQTARYFWVGPDNGLLARAVEKDGGAIACVRLENPEYLLTPISRTFQGRDVFAPAAAHLARGTPLRALGRSESNYARLPVSLATDRDDHWTGAVVYVDRFGNAITNIPESAPIFRVGTDVKVRFPGREVIVPVGAYYQAVGVGFPVAVLGSSGFLEIAINGGSAAEALQLEIGTPVEARLSGLSPSA